MKMIVQIGLPNENYEMQFGLAWSRKKKIEPPTWEFCFNTFFWRFFKNNMKFSYFLKHFWNYFGNFSTHRKDTDERFIPFDLQLNAVRGK